MTRADRQRGSALVLAILVTGVVLLLGAASLQFVRFERMQAHAFVVAPELQQTANAGAERGIALARLYTDPKQHLLSTTGHATLTGFNTSSGSSSQSSVDTYTLDFASYDIYASPPALVFTSTANDPADSSSVSIRVTLNPADLSVKQWQVTHRP